MDENCIYTPFDEALELLTERRRNNAISEMVSGFFKHSPCAFTDSENPLIYFSRPCFTPNLEFASFYKFVSEKNLDFRLLEYPGLFVPHNTDKYFLGNLHQSKPDDVNSVKKKIIMDFDRSQGMDLRNVTTYWGENILTFHNRMFVEKYGERIAKKKVNFKFWFDRTKNTDGFYYLKYLSLFLTHGILFENFLFNDSREELFITEKLLPSFNEIIKRFGIKPLLVKFPFENTVMSDWLHYHHELEGPLVLPA